MRILWLVIIFFSSGLAHAELPGLYKVSSSFTDIESGQDERISGTGILLSFKEGEVSRFFILTVGHVSQGTNLQIKIGNSLVKIRENGLARLANNSYDVEWIEIEDPGLDKVMSSIQHPCASSAEVLGIKPKKIGSDYCLNSSSEILREWNDPSSKGSDELVPGKNILAASAGPNLFTLIPSWTARGNSLDERIAPYAPNNVFITLDDGYRSQTQDLSESYYGGEYEDFIRVMPGMSGSPLLSTQVLNEKKFNYRIIGLVKEYDRRFFASEFVSESVILEVLAHFLSGKRGLDDGTQLLHRKGLSFRKFANGLLSVNPSRAESGNGEKGDSGNGEKGDSGNGEKGDAGSKLAIGKNNDPYGSYGILPGMALELENGKSKSVIALRSPYRQEMIFANDAAADASLKLGLKNFELVELGEPLVPYLYEKISANNNDPTRSKRIELKPVVLPNKIKSAKLSFNSSSAEVEVILSEKQDRIQLHFRRDGSCIESGYSHFTPVFAVQSEKKKTYWIDLRRFFFSDMSLVPYELLSAVEQRTPIIIIREADEQHEYELDFI